jgi:exopolysaccharide biosynthesis polyprenyl glycosylphosphotransferase
MFFKTHYAHLNAIFRIIDFLIVALTLVPLCLDPFYVKNLAGFEFKLHRPVFFIAYLLAWVIVSDRFNLYSSKRFESFVNESMDVFKTILVCILFAIAVEYLSYEQSINREYLLYFLMLQIIALSVFRFFLRISLKFLRKRGYDTRNLIIIGKNERSSSIIHQFNNKSHFGIRILGYLDVGNNGNGFDSWPSGCRYLGTLDDFEAILKENVVDEVLITLPIKSFYNEIQKVLLKCEMVGIDAKLSTHFFNLQLAKSDISYINNFPYLEMYTTPRMSWQLIVKRTVDMAVSSIFLILLSPLLLMISVMIKMTSDGPVLFGQKRVGYNGRLFTCYKFRTMVKNAEQLKKYLLEQNEMDGPVFKICQDPRLTPVGSFLRRNSLDELPQLFNVLKGDMSLVGPRPPLPEEVDLYDLNERRRLSVRPGMTCIWQVSGRNQINFEDWMDMDRKYIDNWSLSLDFKLILKTIPALFKRTGAC